MPENRLTLAESTSQDGSAHSALPLVEALLRNWRRVAGFTFAVGVITGVLAFLLPPTYEAHFSFFPQAKSGTKLPSSLASVAGQFGVSIGEEPTQSPQFYASLLGSRTILEPVLLAKYSNPDPRSGADSLPLIDIYRSHGQTPQLRTENGLKTLSQSAKASVDALTGIVTVTVGARTPPLSAAIADHIMYELNAFNVAARQELARQRAEYTERLSADAQRTLLNAEGALEAFYAENRTYSSSPKLTFEEQRLRRQVEMAQELYLNLMRQYQAAAVDEANNVPALVTVDRPVPPGKRSKPKRRVLVLAAMFLAFATISGVVTVGEYHRRAPPAEAARWRSVLDAWRAMRSDVRALLHLSRRH